MNLTTRTRSRLLAASEHETEEMEWDASAHDRLALALDRTPDGTVIPVADVSDADTPEKQLALDDLAYISLVADYHGIE